MLKLFKNFTKKDVYIIIICAILIAFQVFFELKMPEYMSQITKLVQTDESTMKEILTAGSYMLVCAFGSLGTAILVGYLASSLSASFSRNIRRKIFTKVESFSLA